MFLNNHNRRLKRTLNVIKSDLDRAESEADLIRLVKTFQNNVRRSTFDNRLIYIFMGLCVLVSAFILYLDDNNDSAIFPIVLGGLSYWIVIRREDIIHNLSDRIFQKDVMRDNNLKLEKINGPKYAEELADQFLDLDRGNYSREIKCLYKGKCTGREHSFDISLFHLHYVNTQRRGSKRKKARYDLYGIIVPFGFVKDLMIARNLHEEILNSFGNIKNGYDEYHTTLANFNMRYRVFAKSKMTAAKFLGPVVVEAIERISWYISDMSYDFNAQGDLCLSFKDKEVIFPERQYGLEHPTEFIDEIKQHNHMDKLHRALTHIHTLMKHADSNFESPVRNNSIWS